MDSIYYMFLGSDLKVLLVVFIGDYKDSVIHSRQYILIFLRNDVNFCWTQLNKNLWMTEGGMGVAKAVLEPTCNFSWGRTYIDSTYCGP